MWTAVFPLMISTGSATTLAPDVCRGLIDGGPIPPNGRWYLSGTNWGELASSGRKFWLESEGERVDVSIAVEDPPGAQRYAVITPVHPLGPGRWRLRVQVDRRGRRGGDTGEEVASWGHPDLIAPVFSEVRLANPGWWPAWRGDAILVTLVGVSADPSPLFLDVYLTKTVPSEEGAPLTHNVVDEPLTTDGEWWDRLPYDLGGDYGRTVELFGSICARGLPSGTRVGDEFEVSVRFVDVAGNRSDAKSFTFRVPE